MPRARVRRRTDDNAREREPGLQREDTRRYAEQTDHVESRQQRISPHRESAVARPAAAQDEYRRGDDRERQGVGEDHIVQQLLERSEQECRYQHRGAEEQQSQLLNLSVRVHPQERAREYAVLRHRVETTRHLNDGRVHESGCGQEYGDRDQHFAGGTECRSR